MYIKSILYYMCVCMWSLHAYVCVYACMYETSLSLLTQS